MKINSTIFFILVSVISFHSCNYEVKNKEASFEEIDDMVEEVDYETLEKRDLINKIKNLIPLGYDVLDIAKGDLNLDEYEDIIILLKEIGEDEKYANGQADYDHPLKRPVIILTGTDKGYIIARRNDNMALCYDCGGTTGDPYRSIEILHGYFIIKHNGGSAWRWDRNISFTYSIKNKEWYLFADVMENYHMDRSSQYEYHIYNSALEEKITFEKFNISTNQ